MASGTYLINSLALIKVVMWWLTVTRNGLGITQNVAVCIVWGRIVFGLIYAKRGCWYRLRARLHETSLLVSFGGLFMQIKSIGICGGGELSESKLLVSFRGSGARIEAVGIVWGIGYAKQSCLCCFGAGLRDTGLLMLLGH